MALGFIKNVLMKRKADKHRHTDTLQPHGMIKMQIPITFSITQDELDKYGFTPHEQALNNPRIRNALEKVL
jgi:hypothetical protein